ncbi:hypothetical protein LPJ61_004754 [Coemansia biformis]|uniref:INSIG-domain-containing protein n=1 Tax=Coemansia biformis TaxID=1286918 RepID=A0A9W8CUD8_9FUNG|nr:hypothetical protein LPJ61_004754 [Coemansia biformis]
MERRHSDAHSDSSDEVSDESGQLWLTPKLSQTRTAPAAARAPAITKAPAAARAPATTVAPTATRAPAATRVPAEAKAPTSRSSPQGAKRAAQGHERQLSLAQTLAWYGPRILLLFLIGWSWSVGIRFIHAPQQTVAGSGSAGTTYTPVAPSADSVAAGLVTAVNDSVGSTVLAGGGYDSSDSDDSDSEYLRRWRVASSSPGRGGPDGARGPRRDVIARVLETASWSGAIGGLMTVVVGMGYPFLDCKWQSHPRHAVAWNDVLRCAGGFLGVNYAALKLPFESAHQSSAIMLIIALGLWTVCDGTLHGLLLSASASLSATWLLYMHALGHYGSFSQDDYLGLLATLPNILFTYWVMVGGIGRRLGHHPQWRRMQRPHARQWQ